MKTNLIQDKTFKFALQIIELYKELTFKKEFILSKQILKSGTSIAANQEEAQAGSSKADFISKMSIACKECRETKLWLRLLKESQIVQIEVDNLLMEVEDILNLLYKIIKTSKINLAKEMALSKK